MPISLWQHISTNTLWLLLARISGQGVLFLVGVLIARFLGPQALGQYALITTIVAVGNIATSFGMDTHLMRVAGQTRATNAPEYSVGLYIQLLLSALYICVIWLFADRWTDAAWALRWFSLTLIPLGFATIYSALLRGFERMDVLLRYQVVTAVAQLIGTLGVIILQPTLLNVLLVLGIGQTLGVVYGGWQLYRVLPTLQLWQRPTSTVFKSTLNSGLLLVLLMVIVTLSQRLGTLTLAYVVDETAVGYLNAASRLTEGIRLLPIALFGALFPVLAQSQTASAAQRQQVNRLVLALCSGLVGIALCLHWAAEPIVQLLYGQGWEPSTTVLKILGWNLAITVVVQRFSVTLIARGFDKAVVVASLLQLLLAVPLFYGLTAAYGLVGTAWATVISSVLNALLLWQTWRYCFQRTPL